MDGHTATKARSKCGIALGATCQMIGGALTCQTELTRRETRTRLRSCAKFSQLWRMRMMISGGVEGEDRTVWPDAIIDRCCELD
jgi:hypothetical protein